MSNARYIVVLPRRKDSHCPGLKAHLERVPEWRQWLSVLNCRVSYCRKSFSVKSSRVTVKAWVIGKSVTYLQYLPSVWYVYSKEEAEKGWQFHVERVSPISIGIDEVDHLYLQLIHFQLEDKARYWALFPPLEQSHWCEFSAFFFQLGFYFARWGSLSLFFKSLLFTVSKVSLLTGDQFGREPQLLDLQHHKIILGSFWFLFLNSFRLFCHEL